MREILYLNEQWITIVLLFLLICISVLKFFDKTKLLGYFGAVFSKNFIDREVEEYTGYLNKFQILIFFFTIVVLSILNYKFVVFYKLNTEKGIQTFSIIFLVIFSYFIIKRSLEYLISILFNLKIQSRFFLVSKFSYLYSISFFIFIAIIITQYTALSILFLLYFSGFLFLIRFALHFFNNKKLIFSQLFYFILYLCAFEIAPLLILFKLMF